MVKKLYKFDLKQHEKMRFMNVINIECPNGIKVMPGYSVSCLIARGHVDCTHRSRSVHKAE